MTNAKANAITKSFFDKSPAYASICENRNNRRCHRFTINENLYFEYWSPDEWEFTITARHDDPKFMSYVKVTTAMTMYMNNIRVTYSKLPSLMAQCAARVAEI